jgi:hypothetical protein
MTLADRLPASTGRQLLAAGPLRAAGVRASPVWTEQSWPQRRPGNGNRAEEANDAFEADAYPVLRASRVEVMGFERRTKSSMCPRRGTPSFCCRFPSPVEPRRAFAAPGYA